jgi:hypothetical protein
VNRSVSLIASWKEEHEKKRKGSGFLLLLYIHRHNDSKGVMKDDSVSFIAPKMCFLYN